MMAFIFFFMGRIPFKRFKGRSARRLQGCGRGRSAAPFAKPRCALFAASQLLFAHKKALPQYMIIQ